MMMMDVWLLIVFLISGFVLGMIVAFGIETKIRHILYRRIERLELEIRLIKLKEFEERSQKERSEGGE